MNHDGIVEKAQNVLHRACMPQGIYAAMDATENYRRVWARDAMIAGIAGVMMQDVVVMQGLRNSVITLGKAQGSVGQIPSNVSIDEKGEIAGASFGTLAPRLDSVCWWIIGSAVCQSFQPIDAIEDKVEKAISLLTVWEYNDKGLIYVPMGGNWADEYVTQGYTLYDQLLRARALSLAGAAWGRKEWETKAKQIYQVIQDNYWGEMEATTADSHLYHPEIFQQKTHNARPYWLCSMSPAGYDYRFDLFGNALALTAPIGSAMQAEKVLHFVASQASHTTSHLMPTFFPIIHEKHEEWQSLQKHFLYRFKNMPGKFHNGGIWPMTMGWWGIAAGKWGKKEWVNDILNHLASALFHPATQQYHLNEYIDAFTGQAEGVEDLSFSASGIYMLKATLNGAIPII